VPAESQHIGRGERATTPRLERALADLVGGPAGGWAFALAGLAALEQAVTSARSGADRFRAYPAGWFRALLVDVDDALRIAATAVDVQLVLDEHEGDGRSLDRRRDISELLLARANALADERTPLP
jgi:hypothetical protein